MNSLAVDELSLPPFKNFDFFFENNSFHIIAGTSGSGKTRLIKVLAGITPTKEKVRWNRTYLEKIAYTKIEEKIGVLLKEMIEIMNIKTVEEIWKESFTSKNMEKKEQEKQIKEILSHLHMNGKRKKVLKDLLLEEQIKVFLVNEMIQEKEILLLDDPLKGIQKREERLEIMDLLSFYHKQGNTIIMTTSSLEDVTEVPINALSILSNGKIATTGKPLQVLQQDSLLDKLGLKIPFMADLCVKLQYYDLVHEIILDKERLVKELWK